MRKYMLIAAAGAAAVAATACGSSAAPYIPETVTIQDAEQNVIKVTGREEVRTVPDMAEIVFSVDTQEKDAADCQAKNTEEVNKVIELLKGLGIEETSIQTSDVSLNPMYDWSKNKQTLIGYEMRTGLTVTDVPLDLVGKVLNGAVNVGINNIQSISYQASNYDESYQEALKLAIASAQRKAESMAEAGGCSLGGISNIEEHAANQEIKYSNYTVGEAKQMLRSTEDMSVMPGEVSIEAFVTVEFMIIPSE